MEKPLKELRTGYTLEYRGYASSFKLHQTVFVLISVVALSLILGVIGFMYVALPTGALKGLALFIFVMAVLSFGWSFYAPKYIYGIIVTFYEKKLRIYDSESFDFQFPPKDNEMMIWVARKGGYHGFANISYDNIASVRPVSRSEIDQIQNMKGIPGSLEPGYRTLFNTNSTPIMFKFLSDYSHVVELTLKEFSVPQRSFAGVMMTLKQGTLAQNHITNGKLLVSVPNTTEFIIELNKHGVR